LWKIPLLNGFELSVFFLKMPLLNGLDSCFGLKMPLLNGLESLCFLKIPPLNGFESEFFLKIPALNGLAFYSESSSEPTSSDLSSTGYSSVTSAGAVVPNITVPLFESLLTTAVAPFSPPATSKAAPFELSILSVTTVVVEYCGEIALSVPGVVLISSVATMTGAGVGLAFNTTGLEVIGMA